jgi:hypothetical protein
VVPFKIGALDNEQRGILADFYDRGGRIFSAGPERLARVLKISDPTRMLSLPPPGPDLAAAVQSASGGPLLTISNSRHLAANVTRKADADTLIIHLINYDPAPNEDVRVTFGWAGHSCPARAINIYSPDDNPPSLSDVSCQDGIASFTVSQVTHYAVAVINP